MFFRPLPAALGLPGTSRLLMYGALELPITWEYAWFSITITNTWSKLGTVAAVAFTIGLVPTSSPQARIAIVSSAWADCSGDVRALTSRGPAGCFLGSPRLSAAAAAQRAA